MNFLKDIANMMKDIIENIEGEELKEFTSLSTTELIEKKETLTNKLNGFYSDRENITSTTVKNLETKLNEISYAVDNNKCELDLNNTISNYVTLQMLHANDKIEILDKDINKLQIEISKINCVLSQNDMKLCKKMNETAEKINDKLGESFQQIYKNK